MAASSAQVELWVKGDPKTETLLDCPFCHRVLLAAGEKQVPLTLGYVDFAAKPDWLLKVNPQGSVPVAKDLRASASPENPWVIDSGVICDWLESHFPSPPSVGAVADAASAPGGDVFPAFAGFIKAGIGSPEEAEKRSKLDAAVLSLSKAIQESCKPFLGGDAPQQADFALAPKLHHLSVAAPAHKGWAFPEGSGPVSDYLERMRARPSWKAHAYSDESVVAGWKKNVGADAKK